MVAVLTHGRVIRVWFKIWSDHFEKVELHPRRLKRLLHIEKGVSNPQRENIFQETVRVLNSAHGTCIKPHEMNRFCCC